MFVRGVVFSLLAVVSFPAYLNSQQNASSSTVRGGGVKGIVLDGKGKPLPDATVYAVPEEDIKKQFPTQSNSEGQFDLRGLPAGIVYVNAMKESDGYPYNFFAFFLSPGENTPVKVEVKPDETVTGVRLQLGKRAARLNIEITTDDENPLKGASVYFTRPDQPGRPYGRGMRPKESILVPPVPFHILVQAEGYKDWHYGGTPSGLLSLNPGATFDLAVHLQK